MRHEKEIGIVIVDTDNYRTTQVALDMPEATYLVGDGQYITHYRAEFTIPAGIVPYRPISKRDILLLSRNIVFREQVAYAVLAAAKQTNRRRHDCAAIAGRSVIQAGKEPEQDDIAVGVKFILSAAIVRIVAKPDAHGFCRVLAKFVKPA
ncbi:MAG: hypothetical protein U1F16_09535 [Turneriella sp.]